MVRHDYNTAPGQVDALIRFPDRDVPLEVVSDHDVAFRRQWDALQIRGQLLAVPGLRSRWEVWLSRTADVRRVAAGLPRLLLEHQGESAGWAGGRDRRPPEAFRALGVERAYPVAGASPGEALLRPDMWSGTADEEAISAWVEQVLQREADVPAKLSRHPSTEKHAFLWVTMGSDYGVQFALEDRGQPLPESQPRLPVGVTHIWVAGTMSSQGCLAWFPGRSWWRVPIAAVGRDAQ